MLIRSLFSGGGWVGRRYRGAVLEVYAMLTMVTLDAHGSSAGAWPLWLSRWHCFHLSSLYWSLIPLWCPLIVHALTEEDRRTFGGSSWADMEGSSVRIFEKWVPRVREVTNCSDFSALGSCLCKAGEPCACSEGVLHLSLVFTHLENVLLEWGN